MKISIKIHRDVDTVKRIKRDKERYKCKDLNLDTQIYKLILISIYIYSFFLNQAMRIHLYTLIEI